MKAKYKLILGRRKQYPLNIELEVYKGVDCRVFVSTGISLDNENQRSIYLGRLCEVEKRLIQWRAVKIR
ncbi:MAG: hypothetical protein MJZ27_01185 [Bacteroidales bacterium]|nr:hypothetical protein [Bacteroidales bacterium]